MRTSDIQTTFTIRFPCETPDENGVCYSHEAIMKALKDLDQFPVPIVTYTNAGVPTAVGYITGKPYAIVHDPAEEYVRFSIDGVISHGGTQCIVEDMEDNIITGFQIQAIGFSE